MNGPFFKNRDKTLRIGPQPHTVQWRQIVLRDPCPYCAVTPRADFWKHKMTLEHVEPLSRGGSNKWDNIVGAHKGCNEQRSSRPLLVFLLFRRASVGLPKKVRRRLRESFFAGHRA